MPTIKDKGLQRVYVLELRRLLCQKNQYINANDVYAMLTAPAAVKREALWRTKEFDKKQKPCNTSTTIAPTVDTK